MPVTLRDLLPRVMLHRPDLDDAKGVFCLLEATRELTQKAAIMRDELGVPASLNSRETNFATYIPSGRTLFRAEYMRYLKMPDTARFAGYWDALNNIPDLGEINPNPNPFDRWINIAERPLGIYYSAVTYLGKGKFVLFGGLPVGDTQTSDRTFIQVYDSVANEWIKSEELLITKDPTTPVSHFGVGGLNAGPTSRFAITSNGKILFGGGVGFTNSGGKNYRTYVFDTKTYETIPGPTLVDVSFPWELSQSVSQFTMDDGATYFLTEPTIAAFNEKNFVRYVWQDNSLQVLSRSNYRLAGELGGSKCAKVSGTKIIVDLLNQSFPQHDFKKRWGIYDISTNTWDPVYIENGAVNRGSTWTGVQVLGIGGGKAILAGENTAVQIIDVNTKLITTVAHLPVAALVGRIEKIGSTKYAILGQFGQGTDVTSYMWVLDLFDNTITDKSGFSPPSADVWTKTPMGSDGRNLYLLGISPVNPPFGTGKPCQVFQTGSSSYTKDGYWIVSVPGDTTLEEDDPDENFWELNDVVYNDGTRWHQFQDRHFVPMHEVNEPTINEYTSLRGPKGTSYAWGQENGSLFTYLRTSSQDVLKVNYSYSFNGNEHTIINVPNEAESVIVDGALARLFSLPGEGMDKNLAAMYTGKFNIGVSKMRGVGFFGYGGAPYYTTGGPFGPTNGGGFSVTW